VPATDRQVEFRWMSSYEARNEHLISEHLYFDQVALLAELDLM
jgi:hypothetical protein